MRTSISLDKESFWRLKEAKARLRCDTWEDFAEKIYEMVFADDTD